MFVKKPQRIMNEIALLSADNSKNTLKESSSRSLFHKNKPDI